MILYLYVFIILYINNCKDIRYWHFGYFYWILWRIRLRFSKRDAKYAFCSTSSHVDLDAHLSLLISEWHGAVLQFPACHSLSFHIRPSPGHPTTPPPLVFRPRHCSHLTDKSKRHFERKIPPQSIPHSTLQSELFAATPFISLPRQRISHYSISLPRCFPFSIDFGCSKWTCENC